MTFFALITLHGSLFGLTDDEAYYWVLAQTPSLGYAYHPPAVAWLIALFQALFGWLFGTHSVILVRLPGITCAAVMLGLALSWLRKCGVEGKRLWGAGALLLSFAGLFSLSWMMVPDLPLFLGFTLLLVSVWRLCFEAEEPYGLAALGAVLLPLSKYSGVLALGSAVLAIFLWAPRVRRWKAMTVVIFGGLLGLAPALVWNARHEWASILYQVQGRHEGASLSLARYLRFWSAEFVAAGPVVIAFSGWLCYRAVRVSKTGADLAASRMSRYLALWILPAALVFCLQPLWGDFKPHWAFVVWWPAFLGLAWFSFRGPGAVWMRAAFFQQLSGAAIGLLVLVSCQLPIAGWAMRLGGREPDPRLDVTNDLYGWADLKPFLKERMPAELALPVVGYRYQTASQAAFSLGENTRFTMLPRDLKSRDEWPELGVSEGKGDSWPRLKSAVLFVRDNRYDTIPEFPGAKCEPRARLEKTRWAYPAKWIEVWRCEPDGARPSPN